MSKDLNLNLDLEVKEKATNTNCVSERDKEKAWRNEMSSFIIEEKIIIKQIRKEHEMVKGKHFQNLGSLSFLKKESI